MKAIGVWLTGLPGSGKSTLAEEVRKIHPDFIVLRMDDLRKIVTPEPTYSGEERDIVYRCLVFIAATLVGHGHSVVIDATGNLRKWRDLARTLIPRYGEIQLKCPVELCIERERQRREGYGAPGEIYEKAKTGWPVPGMSAPYEEARNPELLIEVDKTTFFDAAERIEALIGRLQDLELDCTDAE
jgi:adenylylsulfate kinase